MYIRKLEDENGEIAYLFCAENDTADELMYPRAIEGIFGERIMRAIEKLDFPPRTWDNPPARFDIHKFAVEEEREACAKTVEAWRPSDCWEADVAGRSVAQVIRERGEGK